MIDNWNIIKHFLWIDIDGFAEGCLYLNNPPSLLQLQNGEEINSCEQLCLWYQLCNLLAHFWIISVTFVMN